MLTFALIALAAGQVTPVGEVPAFPPPPRTEPCAPAAGVADFRKRPPRSMKLGDQPPANQFYAVYNRVGPCPQPIVVRKGIGANREQTPPVPTAPPRQSTARN